MQSFALNFVGPSAFAIAPSRIINTGLQIRFDFTPSVWSKIKINFWVSSNSEIQVGHFEAGNSFIIQPTFPLVLKVAKAVLMSIPTYSLHSAVGITLLSESSSMDIIFTKKVQLFRFQFLPPTSKEPN